MDKVIEERIDTVNNHRTPSGYYRTKDIGLAPIDWTLGKMSDVITPIKRAVPKPDKPYWRLGIKSWAKGTFHAYVDEPETVDMDELYEVHENDLVVNITFAWEHAIAIANKDDQGLLVSHRFPTYEFKDGQVPNFYKSVISQQFFKDILEHISPGGAGRNRVLNQKDFLNLSCYIPPLSEQRKISEILDHYDKLINLCEAKVNEYKSLKKTCLRKMFPQNGSNVPEIRFPGFTGAWEQRKWSETVGISKDMVDPKTGEFDDLPHVAPGNIESFTGRLYDNVKTVKEENLISGKFRFHAGDIIYGKINPQLGKYIFAEFEGLTSADAYILNAKNDVSQEYLFAILQTRDFFDYSVSVSKRSGMPKINRDELNAYIFFAPSEAEQRKIGVYLLHLDHLITLHQREIKEYTKLKKVMTQLLLTGIVRVK